MTQERLVGLATPGIETDICKKLQHSELVQEFAKTKSRKIKFQ